MLRIYICLTILVAVYSFSLSAFGMLSWIPLGVVYFVGLYQGLYDNFCRS